MKFTETHVKWWAILADRLGLEILTMLEIKGQVRGTIHKTLQSKVSSVLKNLKILRNDPETKTDISSTTT